jgi:RNA polymerase sigma-70 factor, ECF subfamily
MVLGPGAALPLVDAVADDLAGYYLYWATRADLLTRLDRRAEAAAALDRAMSLAPTAPERRLLRERREELLGEP